MHVEEIKAGELLEFVHSEKFSRFNVLPITLHRALSHSKNPRVSSEDVVLIVAYDDTYRTLAYVGALPDRLSDGGRITWNSCWYADPEHGGAVALPLFLKFVKLWQGKIVMQDLTPHTDKIISSLPYFSKVRRIDGKRIFLRGYLTELIVERFPRLRTLKILLLLTDALLNGFQNIRHRRWKRKNPVPGNSSIQIVSEIDKEAGQFIQHHNTNELFRREVEDLQWIISYPWVLKETKDNKGLKEKYYFSSVAKSFSIQGIKLFIDQKIQGFVLIKERNGHIEFPYVYVEEEHTEVLENYLRHFLIEHKTKSFTFFNPKLREIITERFPLPSLYQKDILRELVVSKELKDSFKPGGELQDGDGDCVFT